MNNKRLSRLRNHQQRRRVLKDVNRRMAAYWKSPCGEAMKIKIATSLFGGYQEMPSLYPDYIISSPEFETQGDTILLRIEGDRFVEDT